MQVLEGGGGWAPGGSSEESLDHTMKVLSFSLSLSLSSRLGQPFKSFPLRSDAVGLNPQSPLQGYLAHKNQRPPRTLQ